MTCYKWIILDVIVLAVRCKQELHHQPSLALQEGISSIERMELWKSRVF